MRFPRENRLSLLVPALLTCCSLLGAAAEAQSIRFFGTGSGGVDRVLVAIGDQDTNPATLFHRPADVGATDWTVEFWIRPPLAAAGNSSPAISCGANYNWIYGNIIIDRDRYSQGRTYGVSLAGGRIAFGVGASDQNIARTICSGRDLRDDLWHHVAVQRRRSDGFLWLYVDGILDASGTGPGAGEDLSYPDNGVPLNLCNGPCTGSDPFIVIGAEKHDAGTRFPAYRGWLTELRISTVLRYSGLVFTRPSLPFVPDQSTVALYHFLEGTGTAVGDSSGAAGGPSNGVVRLNGTATAPQWSTDSPFPPETAGNIGDAPTLPQWATLILALLLLCASISRRSSPRV